jgi:hypothetical protein
MPTPEAWAKSKTLRASRAEAAPRGSCGGVAREWSAPEPTDKESVPARFSNLRFSCGLAGRPPFSSGQRWTAVDAVGHSLLPVCCPFAARLLPVCCPFAARLLPAQPPHRDNPRSLRRCPGVVPPQTPNSVSSGLRRGNSKHSPCSSQPAQIALVWSANRREVGFHIIYWFPLLVSPVLD